MNNEEFEAKLDGADRKDCSPAVMRFVNGARWARNYLMVTVDGLSMAEKVAAHVGYKRGCEKREAEISNLKDLLGRAEQALERIDNPYQGIPGFEDDWKSEAVALKIIARSALAEIRRGREGEK